MSLEAQVFSVLAENAELFTESCAESRAFLAVEQFKFRELVSVVMSLTYSAYVQHQQGLIDDEVWQAYENGMFSRLRQPGFSAAWQTTKTSYPKSFQDSVAEGASKAS